MKPVLQVGLRVEIGVRKIHRNGQLTHQHKQHNMILDSGLDYGCGGVDGFLFGQLYNHLAVGTGSTAPAASQNALDAEVGRTSQTLGLGTNEEVTELSDGVFRLRRVRTFDFAEANGNLTEFGGSDLSATPMRTRELFRDGSDNPITVVKTSDERLSVACDLIATCSPTVETADGSITITGIGVKNVAKAFAAGLGSSSSGLLWRNDYRVMPATAALDMSYSNTSTGNPTGGLGDGHGLGGPLPYVDGDFYRDVEGEYPSLASDQTIYGYYLDSGFASNGRIAALKIKFDSSFVKNKDYRYTMAGRISVSR